MFFFFNDTATTEIYTLSLHGALPTCRHEVVVGVAALVVDERPLARRVLDVLLGDRLSLGAGSLRGELEDVERVPAVARSEEHTSELQSRQYIVCRLLLEKKKIKSQDR